MIWRMPGLAAVIILSLGVGIGVNTAVFSWIQAMVLQPVPGVADTGGFQLAEPHGDNGSYPGASWLENATVRDFTTRLLARLRALPGVESAAIASQVPLDIHGLPPRGFVLEGRARSGAAVERALNNLVTPDYFTTMGIPILAGQDFAALDDRAPPPQVVVNDKFVTRFLPDQPPLERGLTSRDRQYRIIGVVRTSLSDSFGDTPTPAIYFSYRDRPSVMGQIHCARAPAVSLRGGVTTCRSSPARPGS